MPNLGDSFPAGAPAPAAGTYQCNAPGCTSSFVASLAGAPLPSAHHAGAGWKLTAMPAPTYGAPKTAAPAPRPAAPASSAPAANPGAPARTRSPKRPPTTGPGKTV